MKTKYILHGGSAQKVNANNDIFFREILKDTPDNVKILLAHFAAPKENSLVNKEKDSSQFERAKENKTLHFEVASKDSFIEQVKKADIVYFGGGTTLPLLNVLKMFNNLKELFVGKTIVGESAGANCLSSYCYSPSGGVLQGLGLVPVKTIPHYQVGDEKVFIDTPKELEMLLLPSYQFKVFYI